MQFSEMGMPEGKTMVLLPGTGLTWELNFSRVIDDLSAKYHLICVDYDGFETNPEQRTDFTDILTIVSKIEDYILENHNGTMDAAYGSSLGGTLAAQLVARGRIHVNHCFIGGSDLDESGKLFARIMTATVGSWFENTLRDEKKSQKLKNKIHSSVKDGESDSGVSEFLDLYIDCVRSLKKGTLSQEFYSDYIIRLPKNINVPGTIIWTWYVKQKPDKSFIS